MTYQDTRDEEQLRRLERPISDFIARQRRNPSRKQRQTIILFPGALGSKLVRATKAYKRASAIPRFDYYTVWLDLYTFLGGALELKMRQGRDFQNKFVIADGSVELLGITPYDGFLRWCDTNKLDWFLFGWDWRRSLDSTRDFFLNKFLPTFQRSVTAAGLPDPLNNFSLIGHSSGGMVVKLILHETRNPYVERIKHAVTVATAFYGYGGQLHRFFEGEKYLNGLGKLNIIRVISSLPGGYVLLFLNKRVFDGDHPLDEYPSMDVDGKTIADPFDPQQRNGKVRYPGFRVTGFDLGELAKAKTTCEVLASAVPHGAKNKFFNFRGMRSLDDTIVKHAWDWILPTFDPVNDHSPITDGAPGPGDDTVPAWSARQIRTPKQNIKDVTGNIHHMFIMEDDQTQRKLGNVLGLKRMRSIKRKRAPARPASSDEALAFVQGLQALPFQSKSLAKNKRLQQYLARLGPQGRERIARRIMMDILKRPVPQESAPPKTKGAAVKTRRSSRKKTAPRSAHRQS